MRPASMISSMMDPRLPITASVSGHRLRAVGGQRWRSAVILAAMTIGAIAALLLLNPAAAQTPTLQVRPGTGGQFQVFTVSGTDFPPDMPLHVTFISPGGEEIAYTADGVTLVIVGADGRFSLSVVPAVDFAGSQAGRWSVSVCDSTGTCWTHELLITA